MLLGVRERRATAKLLRSNQALASRCMLILPVGSPMATQLCDEPVMR